MSVLRRIQSRLRHERVTLPKRIRIELFGLRILISLIGMVLGLGATQGESVELVPIGSPPLGYCLFAAAGGIMGFAIYYFCTGKE